MDSLKPIEEGTAEVLVLRTFEWWTFLALATDPFSRFDHLSFVSRLSDHSNIAIVDVARLQEAIPHLKDKALVIVLMFDGYHAYRARESLFLRLSELPGQIELRTVGEPMELKAHTRFDWRPLFTQQPENYRDKETISDWMRKVSFSRPFGKLMLKHRSKLISAKVLLQLIRQNRIQEYKRTKYVYCGDSGLANLEEYSAIYGIERGAIPKDLRTGSFRVSDLVSLWVNALHRTGGHWTNRIVMRALLRFIALNTLVANRGPELFLNFFPEPNINAYQAGMFFKNHLFLDFGGILGDESIYPRSADILLLNRKAIRFDLVAPALDLQRLEAGDLAGVDRIVKRYQDFVISALDKPGILWA